MEYIMLAGALVAALGGMSALAFRVVRLPLGKPRKAGNRPATGNPQGATLAPREPTQALYSHVTAEYERHTRALREALDLRRARNETEALSLLLNERINQVDAARRLSRFAQPTVGGRFRRMWDQARLDWLADTVRREVAEARFPTAQTRPLTNENAFSRMVMWARGGPQVGAPHDLVLYHREQREHYRLAMAKAHRFVRDQRLDDALTAIEQEQTYHLRTCRALKERFLTGTGADVYGATDPALTAILN